MARSRTNDHAAATNVTAAKTSRSGRRDPGRTGSIRRLLGYAAFLPLASRAPSYVRLIVALIQDVRTPLARKAVLAGAAGYLLLGRDLIPDDIPLLGGIDDLVVVILAVDVFLDGVPSDLLHEKLDELGIERDAFDRDVAQIRRLTPKAVRRTLRRVPQAASAAGRAISATDIGPRLRSWISREGSPA
ncbi:MAG: YkvA family protein [Candidatus Limnocylindrales bacterium]